MSEFNKSYRIRTEVGKDTQLHVKLHQKYDVLEIMSLKINQENAYRLHTSNYGVIAGRVLANGSFGIPNAKISVFINIDEEDFNDAVKSVLYPYNTTNSKDKNGVRYNLLPNEQISDCHTVIGTFPEKQYALDNDSVLEVFEKYYKYTTRTNEAGDYMIFGVPVGSQTIHVDIDLSDIGILSQKPRDMVYKGYDINQFDNPNKFKYDTNLNSLTQVISQDNVTDVIPFWGDETEGIVGITRCDIEVQYKFEPTCVFMGSVVSDTASHGISKKCIPSPGMGAMDELTTGSGTIEMIRKKPDGSVEEFQIQGTQLINGDGVWCYQIPMNLDYMMTDEFGNMVPTNDPNKGIPTRTRVRFRISMQDFETDNTNIFRCKMLVPHNPANEKEIDYQFGTATSEDSYRDLFWNGVYSVKSYIPRIQKGSNWRNEKFTGFKRVNYYGDKNPIPYNNIRIRIPFMMTLICAIFKLFILVCKFFNIAINSLYDILAIKKGTATFAVLDGSLCTDDLENVCFVPGISLEDIRDKGDAKQKGIVARTMHAFAKTLGADDSNVDESAGIDYNSLEETDIYSIDEKNSFEYTKPILTWENDNKKLTIQGIRATHDLDYLIQCIEMNLAQEYKAIQFDFYNDWINGLIYIPRWMRNITKKHTFLWGVIKFGGKVKACNENYAKKGTKRNIVQQCSLKYSIGINKHTIENEPGCSSKNLICHKSSDVRKTNEILNSGGIVKSLENSKKQYLYYFKPGEKNGSKPMVKLFATDIILLGTLNNCDRWGIPSNLTDLVSSTFQIPTNLALTDSDIEGNIYENNSDTMVFSYVKSQEESGSHSSQNTKVDKFELKERGLNVGDEDGNYTELSGIDWGYTGPLQKAKKDGSNLYKPGGHFLGLTCRNSETTIKTCVNLTRICEYGVWMSQRQELNIPSNNSSVTSDNAFLKYATVPTGFISKDEISDSEYRSLFATMNLNKLHTVINNKTGYPIYDFVYVNPINFGGEMEKVMDNEDYNCVVSNSLVEHSYLYDSNTDNTDKNANYYYRTKSSDPYNTTEKQIRRTSEWHDNEYWRFRFGIKSAREQEIMNGKRERFLYNETKNDIELFSFPMYENSYYFYFGLRDGATALDEFKRQYYSVCEKSNSFIQKDNTISLTNITITYDGVCEDNPGGGFAFNVQASDDMFGDNGITVTIIGVPNSEQIVRNNNDTVRYGGLKSGIYDILIKSSDGLYSNTYTIEVPKINLTAGVTSTHFKRDVGGMSDTNIFNLNRTDFGGYISFVDNNFSYEGAVKEAETENSESLKITENIFTSSYIKSIRLKDSKGNVVVKSGIGDGKKEFTFNGNTVNAELNGNGEYMIPVPYFNDTDVKKEGKEYYTVEIETSNINCKPSNTSTIGGYWWEVGTVSVYNAAPLDIIYNGISYRQSLNGYLPENEGENESYEGWWSSDAAFNVGEAHSWKLKGTLYKNSINKPMKITLSTNGGTAPYTDTISGMTESLISTVLTQSDLENVIIPTINFVNGNGQRRSNFSYQTQDINGQIYPDKPFVFPVIYKPFFMEMGLWYFDETKKYYLNGSVYNGRTWDYLNEGFNNVKINGIQTLPIEGLESDTTMKLDEPSLTSNEGGYSYTGKYFKYNGRKTSVTREIEPITYGLHNNGVINNFNLSIGCYHDANGEIFSESINATPKRPIKFSKFDIEGKESEGKYYVRIRPDANDDKDSIKLLLDNEEQSYKYPLENGIPTISDKLHRALIDNNIQPYKGLNTDSEGYIDITNKNNIGSIYYIVTRNEEDNITSDSVEAESKIKAISVSSLINLSSLSDFYPLFINIVGTDTLQANGLYKTEIKITPGYDSAANFKNKKFELSFYKIENNIQIIMQTITFTTDSDTNEVKIDLTPYRNIIGLSGKDKKISFYFDVYKGSEKAPTSYLKDSEGEDYAVNFRFTDDTPKEETPTT